MLPNDFNPIGEGTLQGSIRLLTVIFGDGERISVDDLRDISVSKRFPPNFRFPGRIFPNPTVNERDRRTRLSREEIEAAGESGTPFVNASMENTNFIICPFIGMLVNEGALELKQLYSREELQEVTRVAGLPVQLGNDHVAGNFLNDPDGVQDVWNMEGFTNEHVSSTGIHDCNTEFRFCEFNQPPNAICQVRTRRDCKQPNRVRFERFVYSVDTNEDGIITNDEMERAADVAEEEGIPMRPIEERDEVGSAAFFDGPEQVPNNFVGCFRDVVADRDLPEFRGNTDAASCAQRCQGFKYYGRQFNNECFCGNNVGKHGQATECTCARNNQGPFVNCVFLAPGPATTTPAPSRRSR